MLLGAVLGRSEAMIQRKASWYLIASSAVLFAFVGLIAAPDYAVARIGKCKGGSLSIADEKLLVEAASRVLPPDIKPVVSNVCGSASAEITTQKVPEGRGVTHWWTTSCHREVYDWICAPAGLEKEVEQRLIIDGIERRVAISIDENTPLDLAKSLVTRALRLYADQKSSIPFCGGINEAESRWSMLRESHPLPQDQGLIPVTVRQRVTMGFVLFDDIIRSDDVKIEIQLPIPGHSPPNMVLPCYEAMAP
jgi:hypothetical protein